MTFTLFLLLLLALVIVLAAGAAVFLATRMGGRSFRGAPPPLTEQQTVAREALRGDIEMLAAEPRNVFRPGSLSRAADRIAQRFESGGYEVERQTFAVNGVECQNLIAERRGGREIVVVGAHYDTVGGSPGADDNASGVAAMLELAGRFRSAPRRTIRFVAFVNEEPPFFMTDAMGSWQYAARCRERSERVVAMLSLESIGYYVDRPQSQSYPPAMSLLYPSTGDFLAFVGNPGSVRLVRHCVRAFRSVATVASEGAVLPQLVPQAGWSDQRSFWRIGTPAVMVTDSAPFRNPHYHLDSDLPATIDYDRLVRAVDGLEAVVGFLAR